MKIVIVLLRVSLNYFLFIEPFLFDYWCVVLICQLSRRSYYLPESIYEFFLAGDQVELKAEEVNVAHYLI